ncbi:hypothetical protein QFC20_003730 [Naganishia adeliensis]|uniref:Uncharacterized protein n=1 Tax=Naganishia adeliensis TaxID=92952 RepID=A0ACC2W7N5_9TREE|nr:hypothetical protein QFC20_003730 [Naganishia adeliensis]
MPVCLTAEEQQERDWLSYFFIRKEKRQDNSMPGYIRERLLQFGFTEEETESLYEHRYYFAKGKKTYGRGPSSADQATKDPTVPHLAYIDNIMSNPGKTVGQRMLDHMHNGLSNAADDEKECKQFLSDMGTPGTRKTRRLRHNSVVQVFGRESGPSEDSAASSFDRPITEDLADSEGGLTVSVLQHKRSTAAYADEPIPGTLRATRSSSTEPSWLPVPMFAPPKGNVSPYCESLRATQGELSRERTIASTQDKERCRLVSIADELGAAAALVTASAKEANLPQLRQGLLRRRVLVRRELSSAEACTRLEHRA